jgi:TPR repeat protein
MYDDGQGVNQSECEAMRWYQEAADQGLVNAQFNVGTMFASGQGVKQDFGEAKRWFRKAAGQEDAEAKTAALRMEEMLCERQQAVSPAATINLLSSTGVCSNCGVAESAGSVALKPCSRCKAVVY